MAGSKVGHEIFVNLVSEGKLSGMHIAIILWIISILSIVALLQVNVATVAIAVNWIAVFYRHFLLL